VQGGTAQHGQCVAVAFEDGEQRVRRDAHGHDCVEELRIGGELLAELRVRLDQPGECDPTDGRVG